MSEICNTESEIMSTENLNSEEFQCISRILEVVIPKKMTSRNVTSETVIENKNKEKNVQAIKNLSRNNNKKNLIYKEYFISFVSCISTICTQFANYVDGITMEQCFTGHMDCDSQMNFPITVKINKANQNLIFSRKDKKCVCCGEGVIYDLLDLYNQGLFNKIVENINQHNDITEEEKKKENLKRLDILKDIYSSVGHYEIPYTNGTLLEYASAFMCTNWNCTNLNLNCRLFFNLDLVELKDDLKKDVVNPYSKFNVYLGYVC